MPETQAQSNQPAKAQPVEHVNYWPIEATIWRSVNDSGNANFSVTLQKNYTVENAQTGQKEYQKTSFISERDLPLAAKALTDAHTRIQLHKAQERAEKTSGNVEQLASLAGAQVPGAPAAAEKGPS